MYRVNKPKLAHKLSPEDALIQAGLDSGWGGLLNTGNKPLEQLSDSERKYLHKSAVSYFLAGDPVIQFRVNYYCR